MSTISRPPDSCSSSTTTLAEQRRRETEDVNAATLGLAPEALMVGGRELEAETERNEKASKQEEEQWQGDQGGQRLEEEQERWPGDEGDLRAWLVVLGCFVYGCGMMGYGLTWGVLVQEVQKYHPTIPVASLNLVVGCTNFLLNSTAFAFGRLGDVYGYKKLIGIGAVCTTTSLIVSAFVFKSLAGLFIAQGIMVGVSIGVSMPLFLSLPSQWFKRRRGVATGVVASGAGIGGGTASLILRALMPRLGYRNTLLVYAGLNGVSWLCAFPLLKTRLPPLQPGQSRVSKQWLPKGLWGSLSWGSWIGAIFCAVFGYLSPAYFLTAYTSHETGFNANTIAPAVPLIIFAYASGFGRIFAGAVADRIGPINTLWSSFFLAGVLQLVFWPFAHTYGSIIAFALLEGFTGSWFMSLIPTGAAQLFGARSGSGLATIVGFSTLAGSPGQMLSGTFAGLVRDNGGGYRGVAFFGGAVMVAGSVILLYARFANERRLFAKF